MNEAFPRILAMLRKEKGISQKQAAAELGVSQALLSHYEKGIRECGLEFLVRSADYYGVSCDYMLGRSPQPSGTTISVEDLPDGSGEQRKQMTAAGVFPMLSRRLVVNSLNIIFDLLERAGSKALSKTVSSFLMLAVYRMYRILHSVYPKNQTGSFAVPQKLCQSYANASMEMFAAEAAAIAAGTPPANMDAVKNPLTLAITAESLAEEYPQYAPSLLNLLQNAEKDMRR